MYIRLLKFCKWGLWMKNVSSFQGLCFLYLKNWFACFLLPFLSKHCGFCSYSWLPTQWVSQLPSKRMGFIFGKTKWCFRRDNGILSFCFMFNNLIYICLSASVARAFWEMQRWFKVVLNFWRVYCLLEKMKKGPSNYNIKFYSWTVTVMGTFIGR